MVSSGCSARDTLKGIVGIYHYGRVEDNAGNIMTGFTGSLVYPVVFDKPQTVSTHWPMIPVYSNHPGTEKMLFKGKAQVTNGCFPSTLWYRKIHYQYGNGKISYYAAGETATDAANGAHTI